MAYMKTARKPAGRGPSRGSTGGSRGGRGRGLRKKQNRFNTIFTPDQPVVDYKDTDRLSRFLTEKGKIIPRRITGVTAKQQRILARAIQRARHSGLIAFQMD